MGSVAESVTPKAAKKKAASSSTFLRVINYSALRLLSLFVFYSFFFNDTATTEIYTE